VNEFGFPTTPAELDTAMLDRHLRAADVLGDGRVVDSSWELIGTGKMGDNARHTLTLEDAPSGAPTTVVAKYPSLDPTTRGRAAGGGIYRKEVLFYRNFADRTQMRTPTVYATELDDTGSAMLIVMEDLAPAEPGSQFVGESIEHTHLVMEQAARLAASFHGDQTLTPSDWVMSPQNPETAEFLQALLVDAWPRFLERFGHGLDEERIRFGERYIANHVHFAQQDHGARTLNHGDLRSENILFAPDAAITVDWQTVQEGDLLTDLAYFLGGSVDTKDRRSWERELVEDFRLRLGSLGIDLAADDAWSRYREAAMHGLMITVIGATYSSAEERSDAMFLTMIQRHLQHCVDLESGDFLP
jgi:hypothetical protein